MEKLTEIVLNMKMQVSSIQYSICRENYCPEFGGLKYNDTLCICNSNQCNYDCRYSFSTDWGIEFNGSRYEHHRDVECWNKLESKSGN